MQPHLTTAALYLAATTAACAVAPRFAADATLRQVDGDVAVLGLVTRGEDVSTSVHTANALRRDIAARLGPRARSERQIRAAITDQLEGAALLPAHRRALLTAVDAADADPVRGLLLLREHRAATLADDLLGHRARALFLRAAAESLARGEREGARALLTELICWLGDTAPGPAPTEVPSSVLALWGDISAHPLRPTFYRHALPFSTLLPSGAAHLALTTRAADHLPDEVVEQAARLGLALRVEKVLLAGTLAARPRAFVIDVATRSLERDLAILDAPPLAPRIRAASR